VNFDQWTIIHEVAHAWNNRSHGFLSLLLVASTGGGWGPAWDCDEKHRLPGCNSAYYRYGDVPPKGSDDGFNHIEDFAESVAAYVFPENAQQGVEKNYGRDPGSILYKYLYYQDYAQTKRWRFVNGLINGPNP
jgi:hypothetical protein